MVRFIAVRKDGLRMAKKFLEIKKAKKLLNSWTRNKYNPLL